MNICMAGVDHSRASIGLREEFAFTRAAAQQALENLSEQYPHWGCILLATCNRTELWISGRRESDPFAGEALCGLKGLPFPAYAERMTFREGREAAKHLFYLACGAKSRIFREDQIIAQVREALALAREARSADAAIDRLFQMAVTFAKQVKTEVEVSCINPSAAAAAVALLLDKKGRLGGLHCMVIGNGAMGRLTAKLLAEAGGKVAVTLRTYRHGETIVPPGCHAIPYDERLHHLMAYDAVVSATVSPHYTLRHEQLLPLWDGREHIFIDLAAPRDIDPEIGQLPGALLVDIDHIGGDAAPENEESLAAMADILEEGLREYETWYGFREYVGEINGMKEAAAADILIRVEHAIGSIGLSGEEEKTLRSALHHASSMVVGKMLFGLRDSLDQSIWEPCFDALKEAALKSPQWDRNGSYAKHQLKERNAAK